MGLKCLLGHDFGPSGVVREHEEDGSEMVVTEREIRRCKRCGEEQVLSESTEVRAIRMEDDVRRDADAVAPASSTQGADVGETAAPFDTDGSSPPETPVGDSESTPDSAAPRNAAESVSAPDDAGPTGVAETAPDVGHSPDDDGDDSNTSLIERAEAGFDEPADPDDEDAVILDEEEHTERAYGAWPDSDEDDSPSDGDSSSPTTGSAGVDTDSDGDGDAASAPRVDDDAKPTETEDPRSLAERAAEEDAELLGGSTDETNEADADEPAETGHNEGTWPSHDGEDTGFAAEAATAGGPSMTYGNELTPGSANGQGQGSNGDGYETSYLDNTVEQRDGDGTIVSAGNSASSTPRPGAETEYYCPNCGHARPLDSSLRTGDICPECQQGYIAERER